MLIELPYMRERAVAYALRWALSRNPLFVDFAGIGGDCTNFVSQCILAGSCVINETPDFGWYYFSTTDRAPAWTGVDFFYDFMTGTPSFSEQNGGEGPYASEVPLAQADVGDVIQLANEQGEFYHTLLVTGFDRGTPLVSAHTNDARNRPLDSYEYATLRCLHIEGVRLELDSAACYRELLEGQVFRPLRFCGGEPLLPPTMPMNGTGARDLPQDVQERS